MTIAYVEQRLMSLKNHKKYEIEMEISGEWALWSRPDTGANKVSEICPFYSSVKGIFESVLFMPTVEICPTEITICNPVKFSPYSLNYSGMHRRDREIESESTMQIRFSTLRNVCYKLKAIAINNRDESVISDLAKKYVKNNINHAHAYIDMFNRRLKRGTFRRVPHLGKADFLCDYCGPPRSETKACESINKNINSMLVACFDKPVKGSFNPVFAQNVKIEKGVLNLVK